MGVTRDDVAKLAGVSSATVSYVINDGPRPVSEETRKKVLDAVEALGYRPSAIARSLKTKRTMTVGIVVSDILNPVLSAIAKVIEDELLKHKYTLIICNSDEEPERELKFLQMLIGKQVDGIILLPTGMNIPFLQGMIEKQNPPVLLLDRALKGLKTDCVLFDNKNGAYMLTKHLVELNHKRIALLNLPKRLTPGQERALGYRKALLEANLPIDEGLILESGFKAQEAPELLHDLFFNNTEPPTALLVGSNRLLSKLQKFVKVNRINIPNQLAICAFDDVDYFADITPSITAIATDLHQFGAEATRLLLERINSSEDKKPQNVRIPCQLIVRESTAGLEYP